MNSPGISPDSASSRPALIIAVAGMISLAVAMGVGRFAFTPLYPLMVRDGLLSNEAGALLAGSNYLGYLLGALTVARIRLRPATLLALGLAGIVVATAAVGATVSVAGWTLLRFAAGVLSAWALVATTAWALGWLAALGRPHLAGTVFAGVGLGIAAAGLFCVLAARPGVSAQRLWVELAVLAAIAALAPMIVSVSRHSLPASDAHSAAAASNGGHAVNANAMGLVVCYTLFGFGYILPATYLPAQARQLVDDPRVFGWAWPVFGFAAAASTLIVSWGLRRFDRLHVWAVSHLVMAAGVLLPVLWFSPASIAAAALFVGGTFMVITMIGMQEARARGGKNATAVLAHMTAGFALGQLLGPVASAALGRLADGPAAALNHAMVLAAAGLLAGAAYLWREARRPRRIEENHHE